MTVNTPIISSFTTEGLRRCPPCPPCPPMPPWRIGSSAGGMVAARARLGSKCGRACRGAQEGGRGRACAPNADPAMHAATHHCHLPGTSTTPAPCRQAARAPATPARRPRAPRPAPVAASAAQGGGTPPSKPPPAPSQQQQQQAEDEAPSQPPPAPSTCEVLPAGVAAPACQWLVVHHQCRAHPRVTTRGRACRAGGMGLPARLHAQVVQGAERAVRGHAGQAR